MLIKPSSSANTVDKGTVRGRRYDVRRTHWTRRSRFYVFWWLMSGCSVLTSLYSYIVSSLCLRDHRRSVQSTDPFWRYVQKTLACYNNSDVFNFRRQNIYFVSWCIIIIIIIIFIIFMQNIYNYISATNHVSTVYSVATVLYLQFVLLVTLFHMLNILYFYISTSRIMCVVPSMVFFCSYLLSCFLCMFLKCFLWVILKCFQLPYYDWYHFGFTFQIHCIRIVLIEFMYYYYYYYYYYI